jgi:hypothetical protein
MKSNNFKTGISIYALFILFGIQTLWGQPPDSLWHKTFGGDEHERAFTVMEEEDGIYLIAGATQSYGNGEYDAFLLKLDNNGEIIWEKTYGGSQDESIMSICPALYGGYVLAGSTATNAQGLSDIWLVLVNEEGDSLHSVHYGGLTADQAFCIIPNIDQGYTCVSRKSVYLMGDQVYIMKLDLALDTIWTKTFGYENQDYGRAIIQTDDGGYVIAGSTYSSYTAESGNAWVIRTDSNGDTLWTKQYGGNDEDVFYAAVETYDGYMFAGQTRSFNAAIIDVFVVRTDLDGEVIWSKYYGGNNADYAYFIDRTDQEEFVIVGYSGSFNENDDVYAIKIDGEGEVIWQEHYGIAEDSERMYGAALTSDGGLIATGIMDYYMELQDDLFVLKLGPGNTGFEDQFDSHMPSFYNFPHPVSYKTVFCFQLMQTSAIQIEIFDMSGRVVRSLSMGLFCQGKQHFELDLSELESGVYFSRLISEDRSFQNKIVVSR